MSKPMIATGKLAYTRMLGITSFSKAAKLYIESGRSK
jgi:hypothetical protein